MSAMYRKKVLLHGYFRKNLGDDLFFRVIAARYPDVQFTIPLLSTSYREFFRDLSNVKLVDFWGIGNLIHHKTYILPKRYSCLTMKRYDAVVCIGGSLFIDRKNPSANDRKEIENYSFISDWECAQRHHVPYFVLGANWGPVYNDFFRNYFFRAFESLEDICFRDSKSLEAFSTFKNARKTSDILLNCPLFKNAVKGIEKKKQIAISIVDPQRKNDFQDCAQDFYDKLDQDIHEFLEMGYSVVLLSFCKAEGDESIIRKIVERLGNLATSVRIARYDGNWQDMLHIIAESEIMIAMRFHAMILGWTLGTRVFSVAYSQKTQNVLQECDVDNKSCTINDFLSVEPTDIPKRAEIPRNMNDFIGYNQAFVKLDHLLS